MHFLTIPTIRNRWVAFLALLITVAAAVALTGACGVLLEAGIRDAGAPDRLRGAELVVADRQSVSAHRGHGEDAETVTAHPVERRRIQTGVVERISAVPGVAAAVAEVSFPAHVLDSSGALVNGPGDSSSFGHAWTSAKLTGFRLTAGRAARAPGEVVVDDALMHRARASIGDRRQMVAAGHTFEVTIVGSTTSRAGALEHQAAVFFPEQQATELAGHRDSVELVAVRTVDGQAPQAVARRIRKAIGSGFVVFTGDERARAEFLEGADASAVLIAVSGSLLGLAVFAATFGLAGMIGLLARQREREIALLRATAATPRQIRRMIRNEILVVSVLGAAIGAIPAGAVGQFLARLMQSNDVLPTTMRTSAGPIPIVGAAVLGVLIALTASSIAGRRAARIRPIEAVAEASMPTRLFSPGRVSVGLVALAGAVALMVLSFGASARIVPALTVPLVMTMLVVVAAFSAPLTALGVRAVGLVGRASRVGGYLAGVQTRANAIRLASAVTPVVLAVSIGGMALVQHAAIAQETAKQVAARTIADRVVTRGDAGLGLDAVRSVHEVQGVTQAIGVLPTTIYTPAELEPFKAKAVTPGPIDQVLDLAISSGAWPAAGLGPTEIALSSTMADELHARVGRPVTLRLGDGTRTTPTVAAIYERDRGWGDAVLPTSAVVDHVSAPLLSTVLVAAGPAGIDPGPWNRWLKGQAGSSAGDATSVREAADETASTQALVNATLVGLVVLFAVISLLNSLALAVTDRVRELALLQLIGATRRQVLSMLRWEAFIVTTVGLVLGLAVGVTTGLPFIRAVTGSVALPITPLHWIVLLAATFGLGLTATMLPARFALRSRPIDAIGLRD